MIWLPQVSTSWVGSAAKANIVVGVVQSLSHVQPFSTPWTAAYQASLSFTISSSLLKFTSIESGMLSNHLIFCHPLLFCLQSSLAKDMPKIHYPYLERAWKTQSLAMPHNVFSRWFCKNHMASSWVNWLLFYPMLQWMLLKNKWSI